MNRVLDHSKSGVSVVLRQTYEAQTLGFLTAILRHRRVIVGLAAAALVLATAICWSLPDRYSAESLIQVDLSRVAASQATSPNQQAATSLDAGAIVESEARVIRSLATVRHAVEDLKLQDDPAFARGPGFVSRILSTVLPGSAKEPADSTASVEAVTREVSRNLTVTNDTRAYLINVSYNSTSPERSARIVNAVVDAYLRNRLEMGVAAAERTRTWLEEQIGESRRELETAEAAVDRYRRQTGYVEGGTQGMSLPQQEVRDAVAQLAAARQTRLAAEARLSRAQEVFAAGGTPSAQDLSGAPLIQRMLESAESATREFANVAATGPRHPAYLQAKANIEAAQSRLREEIKRAIGNLESDVKAATADEANLADRVDVLKANLVEGMGQDAKLQSLQTNAVAIRERLKLLSDGHAQALALTGMKSSTTQIVMVAKPVTVPSGPNRLLLICLGVLGAGGVGVGYAVMMDRRDTGFRSDAEIAHETSHRCLGMVPELTGGSSAAEVRMFDESIRLVSAALTGARALAEPRVVMVTSSVPGEGKSLLCMAMATLLAQRGIRTLVIDSTPRLHAETDRPSLEDVVFGDPAGFPPRNDPGRVVVLHRAEHGDSHDLFLTPAFEGFIERARESFDLVLFEAPAVMLSVDVLTMGGLADVTILAVAWNRTPRETVQAALRRLQDNSVRLRGLVLTHVNLTEHKDFRVVDQCSHYNDYRGHFEEAGAHHARGDLLPSRLSS
ncbi:polysaccharide biosynthesis tyrosine autokinase [Methylobacterium sp. Leaf93]|uniref:GumC family protein n=1 Tax=Methylobacterium sp. Leaf93 TaxID=1736249 RepID=UPI0006FEC6B5|nr:polysaccharide biosynthesis tyrosine autokinase [Methylobacterium sp. Leaf93]KQP16632.1 lipopolysaccharide biosynthesis protein [Methylobacterium sp. Leaf93]